MTDSKALEIHVQLDDGSEVKFSLYPRFPKENSLVLIPESDAMEYGEACIQLKEGCSYEYRIHGNYKLAEIPKMISVNRANMNTGLITPNIYVGSLVLEIQDIAGLKVGSLPVEVCAVKTDYRTDYRRMLEYITECCLDLLLQYTSPVTQRFEKTIEEDAKTIYQKFAFVKSVLESDEFIEAIYRVQENPVTNWTYEEEQLDIRQVRRMTNAITKQFARSSNRVSLRAGNYLHSRLSSVPAKINCHNKQTTTDTPENQFVKYVINEFLQFCSSTRNKLNVKSRVYREAIQLESVLENMLDHATFKGISDPSILPLNSPILQRKEGYREILRVWLMFDLAAKLVWMGGDDVYDANKRDVAVLYEYWTFFILLDIICELFVLDKPPAEQLIMPTKDGLGLMLKKGKQMLFTGKYISTGRKLNIAFSFNRTFTVSKSYPHNGSWSRNMRPDYTISVWPDGITALDAEKKELIMHLHFDAKYKINNLVQLLEEYEDEEEVELERKRGIYRQSDLLKMHAYKDAIRRTAGSFILYPGDKKYRIAEYHEVLPAIGAFPLRPMMNNQDMSELKSFMQEVIDHLQNRASQREELAYRVYDIHLNKDRLTLKDAVPDYETSRMIPPNEINIIIGYCKDDDHYKWIEVNGLYNLRMYDSNGPIRLVPEMFNASYLLLHKSGEVITQDMRRITEISPQILSRQELINLEYPNPKHDFYLMYQVEKKANSNYFFNAKWDIRKLKNFKTGRLSAVPFVVSLTELMDAKIRL